MSLSIRLLNMNKWRGKKSPEIAHMGMFTIDSDYVSQSESTTVGEGEKNLPTQAFAQVTFRFRKATARVEALVFRRDFIWSQNARKWHRFNDRRNSI